MKSLLIISTFFLLIFSCSQGENDLSSLENQSLELNKFFEKVSSMNLKTSQENVIYIDYKWNPNKKTIEYLKSEEKEPDFFILESPKNLAQRDAFIAADDYQVNCDNGESSWSGDCDGKWSCGKLIAKCLDEGGCATICQQTMAYAPQTKTFYLSVTKE
ncbi:hypothetical protein OAB04_01165 [Polaribacter sp.]|jgi:hypothetical protein|nr:hypothetical protein [Polaribacter sp.]MDB0038030.1 hypothetical protein [Polaribacter sp.]MDB9748323.1 hypothetical protein [Polaribacter sp.]MDB9847989.1 hypothetical protein [Polaribacter sp.]MDC0086113.1 hypothetical protein [Polaribacter sp.]